VRQLVATVLVLACSGALVMLYVLRSPSGADAGHHHMAAALKQTVLAVDRHEPVRLPSLVDADGAVFAPERLQGRWSVIFFGFTACPDVCPMTLQALGIVARDPASGVPEGTTQIVFVSVDPERDTPERMKSYLEHFGGGIRGLTGNRDAVDRFSKEVSAAYRAQGSGIDHSTSLFVLDPKSRLVGILLRPVDPARIVADLKTLRTSDVDAEHVSLAH
jgi:protein SCO1